MVAATPSVDRDDSLGTATDSVFYLGRTPIPLVTGKNSARSQVVSVIPRRDENQV
jgi:hypothetical protein